MPRFDASPRFSGLAAIGALLALAVTILACGGGDASSGSSTTGGNNTGSSQQQYITDLCMKG